MIRRFPSADRLAPRTGLTRTERSSADHTRRRHISPQGGRWLRRTLVEAAAGAGRAYRAAGSRARSASRSAMAPIMRRVVLIVASSLSLLGYQPDQAQPSAGLPARSCERVRPRAAGRNRAEG